MHINNVRVSPDRRYVNFGINVNFYRLHDVRTFNFYGPQNILYR
jgi:hypothetical protein